MERSSGGKKEDAEKRAPLLGDQDGRAVELLPPDGGWGWMVSLGSALSNIITYPAMQTFALVYKDRFFSIGMSATQISILISVNAGFGMIFGMIHGVFIKRFGYRKVAVVGSIIMFSGMLATSFGNSFAYFLTTHGFVFSFGMSMLAHAFHVALNSYFKERRGKAMGLAMTLTGIGPTVMPLLISQLLERYGVVGTGLIMSALNLHSLVGALLLQPVKWHMRPRPVDPAREPLMDFKSLVKSDSKDDAITPVQITVDLQVKAQNFEDPDMPTLQKKDHLHTSSGERTTEPEEAESASPAGRSDSVAAPVAEDDLPGTDKQLDDGQSFEIPKSNAEQRKDSNISNQPYNERCMASSKVSDEQDDVATEKKDDPKEQNKTTLWQRIATEMDLSLLKDPSFINLLFGICIAITAELNFSMLTPLILADLSFTDNQIALTMSTIAAVDIVFRFLSPFFADYMHYSAKTMYLISLVLLIVSRTTVMFFTTFSSLMLVSVALGVAKGVRTVYMTLVIPSYVTVEQIPLATGMQMLLNVVFYLTCGPIIGYVRDVSGSYNACIFIINILSFVTIVMWLTEFFYKKFKIKSEPSAA
ncbi:monocarboxylate transporter 13-like [Bacillus rossius redtenbacheri]|uniref:monocarboxylate transporter 13-like n=1 Tax=Bacillus rossius redtenbacheri TaxID=93214 RepID=UPI002FDE0A92